MSPWLLGPSLTLSTRLLPMPEIRREMRRKINRADIKNIFPSSFFFITVFTFLPNSIDGSRKKMLHGRFAIISFCENSDCRLCVWMLAIWWGWPSHDYLINNLMINESDSWRIWKVFQVGTLSNKMLKQNLKNFGKTKIWVTQFYDFNNKLQETF